MKRADFDGAFRWILRAEGGYSNDSRDPGGETRYGISKRSHPTVDIAALTVDGARAIYHRDYWLPCRCDEMPAPFALALFDAAVHHGVLKALRLLQRALGVGVDGEIGMETLTALKRATEAEFAEFLSLRDHYMESLPGAPTYLRGWRRRLFLLALASGKLS